MPRVRTVIVYRFRHIGSLFWRTREGPFVNSGTKNVSRMNIGTISHTDRRNSKFFHCIYAKMGQSRIFEKSAIESGGCFSSHTRLPWCKIRPFGFLTKCRTCLKQRTEMSWWHHTIFFWSWKMTFLCANGSNGGGISRFRNNHELFERFLGLPSNGNLDNIHTSAACSSTACFKSTWHS